MGNESTNSAWSSVVQCRWKGASTIFVLALAVRIFSCAGSFQHYINNDAIGFHNLAVNLVAGHGYSASPGAPYEPHFLREPGYPLFLAGVYTVYHWFGPLSYLTSNNLVITDHPEIQFARYMQAILSAIGCVLFFFLLRLGVKSGFAFWIALLFSLYLPFAEFSALLLRETLQAVLVLALSYACARFLLTERIGWLFAFTILWAASNLTLQITMLLGAPLLLFCWIRFGFARAATFSAAAFTVMAILISPWLARSYQYYSDKRIFKSMGTSLTFEGMSYARHELDLNKAGFISRDSAYGNIHRNFYDIGDSQKFARSFAGYYDSLQRADIRVVSAGVGGKVANWVSYIRRCWIESFWVVERADGDFDFRPHGYYRVINRNTALFLLSLPAFFFGYAAFGGIILFYRKIWPLMPVFIYMALLMPFIGSEERRFLPAHAFIFLFSCLFLFYIYRRFIAKESKDALLSRMFLTFPPPRSSRFPQPSTQAELSLQSN